MMRALRTMIKRELMGYFYTPIAYVFLVVFLLFAGVLPLQIGQFLASGQAELTIFFNYLPWLFVVMVPAITMRLWAEEHASGTIEVLLTLPVPLYIFVIAKFLAAWIFMIVAILLTFPFWLTVNLLGNPDNGVILLGYITSILMAGGYIAVGCFVSVTTRSQIIAFICATTLSFFLTVLGTQIVLDAVQDVLGVGVYLFIASLGILQHFQAGIRGIISLGDIIYISSMIKLFLFLSWLFLKYRRLS